MIDSLDARTLAFACSLAFLSVTLVLVLVYVSQRVYAGFREWLLWQVSLTLGIMMFALRGPDPSATQVFLTNVLLLTAPALLFDGLTRFHGLYSNRVPVWSNYGLVAIALMFQFWFCFVDPDINNRILVHAVTRAVLQLRCVIEPLRLAGARRSPAFWLLCTILVLLSISELHHAWRALQPEQIEAPLYSNNVRLALILAILADIVAAYGLVLLTNERVEAELQAARRDIEVLARTDSLTGLWNRRHFEDTLEAEVARARRYGTPLSLLALDADHFKRINDQLGHHAGDTVLREIAQQLSAGIRHSDVLCRWGGEEFMVLVPRTGLEQAAVMAEKIREGLASHEFAPVGPVTVSIGVGEVGSSEAVEVWLRRVDAALYEAKQQGRNCVVVAPTADVPAAI